MSNTPISGFIGQTQFQLTDEITFIRNGTNFRGSVADFLGVLGFAGTITSIGDASGTPILNQPTLLTNEIRKAIGSKGVITALSPGNGLSIAGNFANGTVGAEIIQSLTSDITLFRTLVAGTGINVAQSGTQIQISAVAAPESSKTVIIRQESDFPAPVAGVITLDDDTDYLIVQDIVTSNRFVLASINSIRAASSLLLKITYTGTGDMITSVDSNIKFNEIALSCPNGTLFNIGGTSPVGIFQMLNCSITECDKIGNFDNQFIVRLFGIGWNDIKTNGMTFTNSITNLDLDTSVIFLNGGDFVDLGTATFNAIAITRNAVQASAAGTVFIKGASGSANINIGGLGSAIDNRIIGSATSLSGVSVEDVRWNFLANDDIPDTRPDGLLSMQGNATNTVITSIGVGVLVAGTWVVEATSQMTGTTGGRLTYNGEKDAQLPITISITVVPVSGGSQDVALCVGLNGVPLVESQRVTSTSSGNPVTLDGHWQLNLKNGDFIELFISNQSGTTNLLVSSAINRVN